MNTAIHSKIQKIDHLLQQAPAFSEDAEIQSHWAKYVCVLVSGLLETALIQIFSDYSKNRCEPNVHRYVTNKLKALQNAEVGKILDLHRDFSPAWRDELESFLTDEYKSAIGSIVFNRNKIAHGEESDVSMARITTWYSKAKSVIQKVDSIVSR